MKTVEVALSSDVGHYRMEVVEGDYFRRVLATHRPYEENVLRIVVALTSIGDHIVDVGAHMGNHSVYWALAGRRVTAFEPNPPVSELLHANVERNGVSGMVDVRTVAIGRQRATGIAVQPDRDNLGSIVIDAGEGDIPIYPLDQAGLEPFAVLKIDVEGHEADVLDGAAETLRRYRPFIIAEEVFDHDQAHDLLSEIGYIRLPVNLADTPTRLYAPSRRAVVRVVRSGTYRQLAARALYRRAVSR